MRFKTIREACEHWVRGFNAIPLNLIIKAYQDDFFENIHEITPKKYYCPECEEEYTEDEAENMDYLCNCLKPMSFEEWLMKEGYFNYDNYSNEDKEDIELEYEEYLDSFEQPILEITEDYADILPMCGVVWTFENKLDEDWAYEHLEEMANCGFRIYESDELGLFFGIDGAGYDFYTAHWIPLYIERGLQWHDEVA